MDPAAKPGEGRGEKGSSGTLSTLLKDPNSSIVLPPRRCQSLWTMEWQLGTRITAVAEAQELQVHLQVLHCTALGDGVPIEVCRNATPWRCAVRELHSHLQLLCQGSGKGKCQTRRSTFWKMACWSRWPFCGWMLASEIWRSYLPVYYLL